MLPSVLTRRPPGDRRESSCGGTSRADHRSQRSAWHGAATGCLLDCRHLGAPTCGERQELVRQQVEAWLLASFEQTIAADPVLRPHAHRLRKDWRRALAAHATDDAIESSGCPKKPGSGCTRKLSADLTAWIAELDADPRAPTPRYSKAVEGAQMLMRADPDSVAQSCRNVFAPALRALRELAAAPPAPKR